MTTSSFEQQVREAFEKTYMGGYIDLYRKELLERKMSNGDYFVDITQRDYEMFYSGYLAREREE